MGRRPLILSILFAACGQPVEAPGRPEVVAREEVKERCVPGASAFVGDIPADVVLQWSYVRDGYVRAWRVHDDGRFDWTYGRPVPLDPVAYATWYDGPRLTPEAVASIRKTVADRLPALVTLEPEESSMHVPPRRGFDAPGVASAWYSGGCEPDGYFAFAAELDRLLDADGMPRTRIRERGSSP